MSTIIIPDSRLNAFYKQNPGFDILHFNLSDQAEVSRLNWQGLDQATILPLLKQYQRLLRLYPDPQVARVLLGAGDGGGSVQPSLQEFVVIGGSTPPPAGQPVSQAAPAATARGAPQPGVDRKRHV